MMKDFWEEAYLTALPAVIDAAPSGMKSVEDQEAWISDRAAAIADLAVEARMARVNPPAVASGCYHVAGGGEHAGFSDAVTEASQLAKRCEVRVLVAHWPTRRLWLVNDCGQVEVLS